MTDRQRKIEALRALAERPGTPAEGEVARKKLAELEAREPSKSAGKTFREILDEMEPPTTWSNKATVDITLENLRRANEELKRASAEREYWKRHSGETERRNAERMKAEAERVESERKKREEEDRIRRENLERLRNPGNINVTFKFEGDDAEKVYEHFRNMVRDYQNKKP